MVTDGQDEKAGTQTEMEVKPRGQSLHFSPGSRALLQKGSEEALPERLARRGGRCYGAPATVRAHQSGPCRTHGFQENGVLISLQEELAAERPLSRRVSGRLDGVIAVAHRRSAECRPSVISLLLLAAQLVLLTTTSQHVQLLPKGTGS